MGSLSSAILAAGDELISKIGAITVDNGIYKRIRLLVSVS